MTETLTLNLNVYPRCGVCGHDPSPDARLTLDVLYEGLPATVVVCHACLAARTPNLLAELDSDLAAKFDDAPLTDKVRDAVRVYPDTGRKWGSRRRGRSGR